MLPEVGHNFRPAARLLHSVRQDVHASTPFHLDGLRQVLVPGGSTGCVGDDKQLAPRVFFAQPLKMLLLRDSDRELQETTGEIGEWDKLYLVWSIYLFCVRIRETIILVEHHSSNVGLDASSVQDAV